MSKKALVINGQLLNINRSGGGGRYGRQLYLRLIDPERIGDLRDYDVYLPNFQLVEQIEKSGMPGTPSAASRVDRLKHVIHQSCPPYLFSILQNVYNRSGNTGKDTENKSFVQDRIESDWSIGRNTTLLHEMTNYRTADEIGRFCLSPKSRLAVTFLDIQDYFYPEFFTNRMLKERRLAYSFYKDRADLFIAISHFTKQTMVEHLGIEEEKIRVIPLAADDLALVEISEETTKETDSYGRFWLYSAKFWKNKNHEFLFSAFGKRRDKLKRANIRLLLTGGNSEQADEALNRLIQKYHLEETVNSLGFVSDEKLQALFRNAEFFIFPSLFEGFGMPILEAMTLGCPVLSSRSSSLTEVGGDAARYFDPDSEDELIGLIDEALSGSINRDEMISKGLRNAGNFSWDKAYSETIGVYNELLG